MLSQSIAVCNANRDDLFALDAWQILIILRYHYYVRHILEPPLAPNALELEPAPPAIPALRPFMDVLLLLVKHRGGKVRA